MSADATGPSRMVGLPVVGRLVKDATENFCDQLDHEINRGNLTDERAKEALRLFPDFSDAWEAWCEEGEQR